tara:strand:- start:4670 stop:5752 length:1083 start_codon:yes stop_codon:yes gene_type:complete
MYKKLINDLREYIFIILTATIFSSLFFTKSLSEENVFVVDNVVVEGEININFTREKYIDKAFINSFDKLMSKVLLTKDFNKLDNIKLSQIRSLIKSFQIVEESYKQDTYKGIFKIYYNDSKIKQLLVQKNISFSEPKKISAVFFPVLFINNDFLNFSENYFYKKWLEVEVENELINFIMPIEDLDDIEKIKQMRNQIDMLNFDNFILKYNTTNYIFSIMDFQNNKLNIYLKTNFNNSELTKNITYDLNDFKNENELKIILKELKFKIIDIWKSENIINLATPLSINVKFNFNKVSDLDNLKKALYKINIIEKHFLDEFDINTSIFKIYYFGNPKKLSNELFGLGYDLINNQGKWEIYKNE